MTSSEITRKAKSNLAYALNILPKEQRDDMVVFYAYCRVIDDIADDESRAVALRKAELDAWHEGIHHGFQNPDAFQTEVLDLVKKYDIAPSLMCAIIDGCRMDTEPQRFETWEELQEYTWKVASAVGLISVKLFGASAPESEQYAVTLGHALQLTNILRDINEDLANENRIYLPRQDMQRFGYSEDDLIGRRYDDRFRSMMTMLADRAEGLYLQARKILPMQDRRALMAAEVMAEIYHTVLDQMRADQFRVFEKRYALSKFRKLAILGKHLLGG
jgi:15-cis-phytoene synthase